MTGLALNVGLYGGNPSLYGGNVGIYGGSPGLYGGAQGNAQTLDVAGPELVTNGQFTSNITGWTNASSAGGAIAWNSGAMRLTNTTGTARGRQTVSGLLVGERYSYFALNPAGTVAASITAGSSAPGTTEYVNVATNPAIAGRVAAVEFTATTTTAYLSFGVGAMGNVDIDNVTLRRLIPTQFPQGTVFSDDFSLKPDGPLGLLSNSVPWLNFPPYAGPQVYAQIVSGKMAITASGDGTGTSASYPYVKLGNGKVAALYCDIQWSADGAVAMISMEPTGTLPTVPNIVANSVHIVFTSIQVNISTYVAGVLTSETVTYTSPAVTDGRTYAGVGWTLSGSTLTVTLPDGSTVQRTDSKFAQVQGSVAIPEIYYTTAAPGPLTISKVSVTLG